MSTILWVFIAFAFAVILFTMFQNDLPEELSFLKNVTPPALSVPEVPGTVDATGVTTALYQGWTIRKTATAVEFVRPMPAGIEVNGTRYADPEFGLLCNAGKLDIRIDARATTTGRNATPVTISGMAPMQWDKSATKNIFPRDAAAVLAHLSAHPQVEVTLSYAELGAQKAKLDASALPEMLQALPASCR